MIRLACCTAFLVLLTWPSGDDVHSLNERARSALEQGRAAEAVTLLESAHAIDPDEPVLRRNLAYAYFSRGKAQLAVFRYADAASDFRRAIATWPDEPGYALHLASLHLRRYQLSDAEAVLHELIDRSPVNADAHMLLGDTLNLMDRLPEALDAYDRALELGDAAVAESARRARQRTARQHEVEKDYITDRTSSFVIRHPPETNFLKLSGVLDRARAEVCSGLSTYPSQPAIVVLYPPEAFREVTGTHDWVGGLFDRKIRLPIADPERDRERIEQAFRHEFTHLLVSELAPRCPTFLNEGLAQLMELGRGNGIARLVQYMDGRGLGRDDLPRLADLPASFVDVADRGEVNLHYLFSYAFVDHVVAQHGLGAAMRWVRGMARQSLEDAFYDITHRTLSHEEDLFRELVRTSRG